jgi:hypothetical protein
VPTLRSRPEAMATRDRPSSIVEGKGQACPRCCARRRQPDRAGHARWVTTH